MENNKVTTKIYEEIHNVNRILIQM